MQGYLGLHEELHNVVVELALAEPAKASVTALWGIIAKNELIELTLFKFVYLQKE